MGPKRGLPGSFRPRWTPHGPHIACYLWGDGNKTDLPWNAWWSRETLPWLPNQLYLFHHTDTPNYQVCGRRIRHQCKSSPHWYRLGCIRNPTFEMSNRMGRSTARWRCILPRKGRYRALSRSSARTTENNFMLTSSNKNIFRVTGPLWEESTGHRWIPLTKASDAEPWCFLWCAPQQTVEQRVELPVIWEFMISMWRHCNATMTPFIFMFTMSLVLLNIETATQQCPFYNDNGHVILWR